MYWISRGLSFEQPYSERSGEDYIAGRTRMPVVESAVYRYPNGQVMIKEERVVFEEQRNMSGNWYKYDFPSGNHHGYRAPEAHKKVHFAELDKTTGVGRNGKYEATGEKFENKDDSFIQRNHKNNMNGNQYKYNFPSGYRYGSPDPEAQKKAHFVEGDKTNEVGRNGKREVTDEKVENNDSFMQRNHMNMMYGNQYKYNFPSGYLHESPAPEAQKKAQFVERDKVTEVGRNGKHEVTEDKVDNEADSFIKRKLKSFELAKMDTFKVY
ncbi:hypothetical protein FXO38_22715 [Capsicum annuum]|nr:hypothetical protein FXO37_26740 [Capsicum annuum]KAF3639329.1 hypothetical protein FXO38_22715 [Capsicum annuum]